MENYICIDDKKIEISKETADNLRKEFSPVTYKRGDVFRSNFNDYYIISKVRDNDHMTLTNIVNGNSWSDDTKVEDCRNITEQEFSKMCSTVMPITFRKVNIEIREV